MIRSRLFNILRRDNFERLTTEKKINFRKINLIAKAKKKVPSFEIKMENFINSKHSKDERVQLLI